MPLLPDLRFGPLPGAAWQPGAFFRVTLSNPVHGQLDTVTRAYFGQPQSATLPPQLGCIQFADETLVYWNDSSSVLLQTTNLAGAWITKSTTPSPLRLDLSRPQELFRLKR